MHLLVLDSPFRPLPQCLGCGVSLLNSTDWRTHQQKSCGWTYQLVMRKFLVKTPTSSHFFKLWFWWVSSQTEILSILFFLLDQWNVCSVLWGGSDTYRNRKLPDNFFTGVNVTVSLSSTSSFIWSNRFFNISDDSWHYNCFDISILMVPIVIWSHHL